MLPKLHRHEHLYTHFSSIHRRITKKKKTFHSNICDEKGALMADKFDSYSDISLRIFCITCLIALKKEKKKRSKNMFSVNEHVSYWLTIRLQSIAITDQLCIFVLFEY